MGMRVGWKGIILETNNIYREGSRVHFTSDAYLVFDTFDEADIAIEWIKAFYNERPHAICEINQIRVAMNERRK